MEARKITLVLSNTQSTKTIMSGAETLGELKNDLYANNINYADMAFYEGLTKSELKSDDSLLPKNVEYRGKITNELVFMLTTPNKKIASGLSRQELYRHIKNQHLEEFIKTECGRNYTQCKSDKLERIIQEYFQKSSEKAKTKVVNPQNAKKDCAEQIITIDILREAIKRLIISLLDNNTLSVSVSEGLLRSLAYELEEVSSRYSKSEIDNMFKDIC